MRFGIGGAIFIENVIRVEFQQRPYLENANDASCVSECGKLEAEICKTTLEAFSKKVFVHPQIVFI